MSRNRLSAKRAGARFNAEIATALATHVDDRIEVRHLNGARDRGDIAALRHPFTGGRIIVESKNWTRLSLGPWATEAEAERINDQAIAGIIAHKRHGVGDPLAQWLTMTVLDGITLLTGRRPA